VSDYTPLPTDVNAAQLQRRRETSAAIQGAPRGALPSPA
jgi:hypothetical protein